MPGSTTTGSVMAPRNLRKKRVADSDDEEDEQGAQALRERMEDAKTLIKNRVKSKVPRRSNPRKPNASHALRLTCHFVSFHPRASEPRRWPSDRVKRT